MQRAKQVAAYLDALGPGNAGNDPAGLAKLIRSHLGTFAFSSLGVQLGDSLDLDPDSLFDRIVTQRRGGYCFEQNGLFFEVLQEMGFAPVLMLARVLMQGNVHPGLTHRMSLVDLDGRLHVADVGFGLHGPRVPVPIDGEETRDDQRCFRVVAHQGELHLQIRQEDGWSSLYKFVLARYGQQDCVVGHFYSHRHPDAMFVRHLVATLHRGEEVQVLRNLEYKRIRGAEVELEQIVNADRLWQLLRNGFGLQVSRAEATVLYDKAARRAGVGRLPA